MSTPPPVPPTWVRKRDGRLVPFEADKISRALFAAGEHCGRPNAFLARELADVVTHFLADEMEQGAPTTEQVAEIVVKVLRELKQHALAEAFEDHAQRRTRTDKGPPTDRNERSDEGVFRYRLGDTPAEVRDACLRDYTLQGVYTRDLVSAHRDGLLTLGGLEAPEALASCLLAPPFADGGRAGKLRLLEELAAAAGRCVVLDGADCALAGNRPKRAGYAWAEKEAGSFLQELSLGLRLSGRTAVLNLNGEPPPWAAEVAEGPLFAAQNKSGSEGTANLGDALAEMVLQREAAYPRLRIDWHLGPRDFDASVRERLVGLARAALVGSGPTFVFDRPRRPLSLAEGVQRRHPAVLLTVGLRLSRLAALVAEELPQGTPEDTMPARSRRLLERLRSLARLALSAAQQKRDFLRRQTGVCPALTRGFLLERSRLLVVPVGLDQAVQTLLGRGLCSGGEALELGCEILQRLKDVLRQEGRVSALQTCLGSAAWGEESASDGSPALAAGITCWEEAAPVRAQLRTIGELHTAAEGGTGTLFLPADPPPTADQVADWLRWAWNETMVLRLRLLRSLPTHRQLTFPAP